MSKGCLKCGMQNADDARVCRGCGTPLSTLFASTQAPPAALGAPKALWFGLGALAVALAAGGGVWWVGQPRAAAAPTFDSAPPPSVLAASSSPDSSAAPGVPPVQTPAPSAAPPPTSPPVTPSASTATASPPAGNLWEPIVKEAAVTVPSDKQRHAAKEKTARDAKAKALREQRAQAASQAEAAQARRRTDAVRARGVGPAPAAAALPRPLTSPNPVPPPAQPRSVQERCANRSALAQGICESRECARAEHAGEAVCQRIKAADDRRRDP